MKLFRFQMISKLIIKWLSKTPKVSGFPLSDYERIRHELKSCDVLLVEGKSRVSRVIKLLTQSPWSHAFLYVGRLHDIEDPDIRKLVAASYNGNLEDQLIIESELGVGTVVRSLSSYKDDHIRICRPRNLSHLDGQKIVAYLVHRLGMEYDVRQIFDLARFLFPWFIMPRRWRSSLFTHNAGSATRTVCSTIIAHAFQSIQFPILPLIKKDEEKGLQLFRRNPKLMVPRDFDYSPYFDIIKYPFVDFSHHSGYQLLPWSGKAELTGEESQMYLRTEREIREESAAKEEASSN
ncbi:MAG: lipo-like protein [Pseudomonadales bacterium]|nr:lipo-like protein [Pseudomonadales bacterium]